MRMSQDFLKFTTEFGQCPDRGSIPSSRFGDLVLVFLFLVLLLLLFPLFLYYKSQNEKMQKQICQSHGGAWRQQGQIVLLTSWSIDPGCGSILLRLSSLEHFFDGHRTFFFPDLHISMQCISDISINI